MARHRSLVWEQFAAAAAAAAARPALIDWPQPGVSRELSFTALSSHATLAALALATCLPPTRAGDPPPIVALLIPQGRAYVAACLACLAAGAAFAPLDATWPPARLAAALERLSPAAVAIATESITDSSPGITDSSPWAALESLARAAGPSRRWGTVTLPPLPGDEKGRFPAPAIPAPASAPAAPHGLESMNHESVNSGLENHGLKSLPFFAVLPTSGTAGAPRLVCCTERGLLARLDWGGTSLCPWLPGIDVAVQKTAPAFVDALPEFFGPLLAGCSLAVLSRPAIEAGGMALAAAVALAGGTRLTATPTALRRLAPHLGAALRLRLVISSGEPLTQSLAQSLAASLPQGCRLVSLYGCTESGGDSAVFEPACHTGWEGGWDSPGPPICPAGYAAAGATLHVLPFQGLESVIEGAEGGGLESVIESADALAVSQKGEGELCISGPGLAAGYWRDPDASAARFPTVRLKEGEIRVHRTGDVAKWGALPGGGRVVWVLGRRDDQVKVRGERLSLGAVSAAIAAHPRVVAASAHAVCLAGEEGDADAVCVAFEPEPGLPVTAWGDLESVILAWARRGAGLCGASVPLAVRAVAALPMTESGKVARGGGGIDWRQGAAAGGSWAEAAAAVRAAFAAALTSPITSSITSSVPDGADFFADLGGSSLGAAAAALSLGLPLASFFASPTVRGLASLVMSAAAERNVGGPPRPPQKRPRVGERVTAPAGPPAVPPVSVAQAAADAAVRVGVGGRWVSRAAAAAAAAGGRPVLATPPPMTSPSMTSPPMTSPSMTSSMTWRMAWRARVGACVDAPPLRVALASPWPPHSPPLSPTAAPGPGEDAWLAVVGSHAGSVVCVGACGDAVWETWLGGRVEAGACLVPSPGGDDGPAAAVGCYDGSVSLLRLADGSPLWRFLPPGGGEIKSACCLDPTTGLLWLGTHGGRLWALDVGARGVAWSLDARHPVFGSPVIDAKRRRVLHATLGGELGCVQWDSSPWLLRELRDGHCRLAWTRNVGGPVFGSPAVDFVTGVAFAAGADGSAIAVDVAGGAIWAIRLGSPVFASPVLCGNDNTLPSPTVLIGTQGGELVALDAATGCVAWRMATGGPVASAPGGWPGGNLVVVAATTGLLTALAVPGGVPAANLRLPGEIFGRPAAFLDGEGMGALVGCRDDYVYCLRLKEID